MDPDHRQWPSGTQAATVQRVPPRAPSNAQLGHAIRRLRHARRMSIETLAAAAGMHPTYLSAIERGTRNPSWTKLCDLAEALEIQTFALVRAAEAEAYGALHTPLADIDRPRTRP